MIFVIFVCFFVYLFCLYLLSNDDFIFLRKDVSVEKVFNVTLLVCLVSILFSRILYVAMNPNANFLNPLVFLLLPYFPGLSLTGAVVGGAIVSFLLSKKHKIPEGRFFDFLAFSLLASLPIGFLGFIVLGEDKTNYIKFIGLAIVYALLFIVFLKLFLPLLLKGKFKDGTVGFLFLIFFSVISLINNLIARKGSIFQFDIEAFILISVFIVSLVLLIRQEKLLGKVEKYWETRKT